MRRHKSTDLLPTPSQLRPPFLGSDPTRTLAAAWSKADAEQHYRDNLTDIWNVAFPAGVAKGHEEGWKASAKINERAGFGQGFSTAAKLFTSDVEHIIIDRRNPDPTSFVTGIDAEDIMAAAHDKQEEGDERFRLFVTNDRAKKKNPDYNETFTEKQLYKANKYSVIENGDLFLVNKKQLQSQGLAGKRLNYAKIEAGAKGTVNDGLFKITEWGGEKAKKNEWGDPPTAAEFLESIYKPPKQGAYSKPKKADVKALSVAGLLEYKAQPNNLFT